MARPVVWEDKEERKRVRRIEYESTLGDVVKCSKCNEEKLGSEFYFHAACRNGRNTICKACHRRYHNEGGYKNVDKEKQRAAQRRYNKKIYHAAKNGDMGAARTQLWTAIRKWAPLAGYMEIPDRCALCGKKCKVQGHHNKKSRKECETIEELLDVEWLCNSCHKKHHGPMHY